MRSVHHGPPTWLVAQVAVLSTLAATFGLGALGWALGMACAALIDAGLALGLARIGARRIGPADRVTLTRATLACGVAALTADAFVRPPAVSALVALTVVALVLDSVDGAVARRTGTTSALGARFDMEVDAFLILVLSAYAARSLGMWVLGIGGRAMPSWRPAGSCPGCVARCRRATGGRSSQPLRASCWPQWRRASSQRSWPRPRSPPRWPCSRSPSAATSCGSGTTSPCSPREYLPRARSPRARCSPRGRVPAPCDRCASAWMVRTWSSLPQRRTTGDDDERAEDHG